MAHLTYVKVLGLAGRKKPVQIEFARDVNVIYGVNGIGKTTLLKILHSALYGDEDIVDELPFESAEVGVFSVAQDREIVREIDAAPRGSEIIREEMFSHRYSSSDGLVIHRERAAAPRWRVKGKRKADAEDDIRLAHEYLPTTRLLSLNDFASLRRRGTESSDEASINAAMELQLQQQWVKYFAPLQGEIEGVQQRGIARILSMILSPDTVATEDVDLAPEVAFDLAKSFLASHSGAKVPSTKAIFVERYKSEKNLAAVVNEIAVIEREASHLRRPRDELQSLLNKLFLNKSVDLSEGQIRVSFSAGSSKKATPLRLSQLSSGEKQALYILIHALRAHVNSLIIDEPELSMHIDWQRQLIRAIRSLNPETQIVMATHSPEIMADVRDECIFEI